MKEQLISFETAKLAKEKEFFDKTSNGEIRISQQNVYSPEGNLFSLEKAIFSSAFRLKDCYNAPTQSLLQKWIREVHNINILISPSKTNYFIIMVYLDKHNNFQEYDLQNYYKTYEEALETGLLEALKII